MMQRQAPRRRPDHQFARQAAGVTVLLLGVRGLGALKEILLARAYGVGPLMDAYQFVLQLISWAPSIFLAIGSATLIPSYALLRGRADGRLGEFQSQVRGATVLLSLALAFAWWLLTTQTPLLTHWSGLSPEAVQHALAMALPMALMVGASVYVGLLITEGIASQLNGINLLEATPAAVLIGVLLFADPGNANLLVAATIGGVLIQAALLSAYTSRHTGRTPPTWTWDHPQWQAVWAALGTLLLAQLLQAATNVVDQFWAARSGHGAVSVMAYANRVLFLAMGIGATAITRVALPLLADLAVQQPAEARRTAGRWALAITLVSTLGIAILWPVSESLVRLIFERGAFGPDDTRRVASYLQVSWLQWPAYLGSLVLIQLVLAESKYRLLVWFAACNLVVKLIANALLVTPLGVNGLALSTALMQWSLLVMLGLWLRMGRHA